MFVKFGWVTVFVSLCILWLYFPTFGLAQELPERVQTITPAATPHPTRIPPIGHSPSDGEIARYIFPFGLPSATADMLSSYDSYIRQDIDVTGDGIPEIVVTTVGPANSGVLTILSKNEDAVWQQIFTHRKFGHYLGKARTKVMPNRRITIDYLTRGGGTGISHQVWEQVWVECTIQAICQVTWSADLMVSDRYWNGQFSNRDYMLAEIQPVNQNQIKVIKHRFFVRNVPLYPADEEYYEMLQLSVDTARRGIGPDVAEIYQREADGIYRLQTVQPLTTGVELAKTVDGYTLQTFDLIRELLHEQSADYEAYQTAVARFFELPTPDESRDAIWGNADVRRLDYYFDPTSVATHNGDLMAPGQMFANLIVAQHRPVCRLGVHRLTVSRTFEAIGQKELPCEINFSKLAWLDVTGDGQDELLWLMIPTDQFEASLQRLYIFSARDELNLLASVEGYINGADGVGIRWEGEGNQFTVIAGIPLEQSDWAMLTLERRFRHYQWHGDGFEEVEK